MEAILKTKRQYNSDHGIWPSENKVIDRLLERSVEMQSLYGELRANLDENQLENLWDALLGVATLWTPESSRALREDQKSLTKINEDIAKLARDLAELMRERYEISERTGFISYEDYHVVDWIDRAAKDNYLYRSYVQENLQNLSTRFDLKYWPRTSEVVDAVADFASEAEIYVNNEWTEELISSPKSSKADYLRVLLKAIDDRKTQGPPLHLLPVNFKMSDSALATFINCSLDLSPDEMVAAEYVKRSRQNIREKKNKRFSS